MIKIESAKHRLQINVAVSDGRHAVFQMTKQRGRGPKETQEHFATIHSSDHIEVANEFDVPLGTQVLIAKVLREAVRDDGE